MLDLSLLERIRFSRKPVVQRVVSRALVGPTLKQRVEVEFEGCERIPDYPIVIAMNHTDRYNYFPFLHHWHRRWDRHAATWVKGKYYENVAVAKFMEWTNQLPVVSRGFLVSKDFLLTVGRRPNSEEYEVLKEHLTAAEEGRSYSNSESDLLPQEVLGRNRDMFGRYFDASRETYGQAIFGVFRAMMARFVKLNGQCFEKRLDLLVFPQGTRSVRLSQGHIGLAQIVLRFGRSVLPVGCSGSDLVYPGNSPWPRRGKITYRFGDPILFTEMKPFHIMESFEPFTSEAERRYKDAFRGLTDMIMDRIERLLEEPYRYDLERSSDGVAGVRRFV